MNYADKCGLRRTAGHILRIYLPFFCWIGGQGNYWIIQQGN